LDDAGGQLHRLPALHLSSRFPASGIGATHGIFRHRTLSLKDRDTVPI
jgi:hypothetical protein